MYSPESFAAELKKFLVLHALLRNLLCYSQKQCCKRLLGALACAGSSL